MRRRGDGDLAVRGVSERVVDEVLQHLTDPKAVGAKGRRRGIGAPGEGDAVASAMRE
jgi:hypothetical protein